MCRNTKNEKVRTNNKKLGRSIDERPKEIDLREEFGHWEIDTVIGEKNSNDNALLTIVERKTRYSIVRKIKFKTSEAVIEEIKAIADFYGKEFNKVFKTITGDNGSEFADLSIIESYKSDAFFTNPYSSCEKGTNERYNGLIRRFIPKGKSISDYNLDDIAFIEKWMNTLPRKILGYKTLEELFEKQLDQIYAT